MVLTQMGSLNALEQTRTARMWKRLCGTGGLPSVDRISDVACLSDLAPLRTYLLALYRALKRRKALRTVAGSSMAALVLDGHECASSYVRHCDECLSRQVQTNNGPLTQYYHRLVLGMLVLPGWALLLDVELQRVGEDEVACAQRLLERLLQTCPRAFDIVLGDGLYVRAGLFEMACKAGKHVVAVLKDERRDLIVDVQSLCAMQAANSFEHDLTRYEYWDIEQLRSWSSVGREVRVVRSVETAASGRTSQWLWVTTIPKAQLSAEMFIPLAHKRWDIENRGFNELVTYWHADHVYRHHPTAICFFWLTTIIAYDIFHALFHLNLKPALRASLSKKTLAQMLHAELLHSIPLRAPP